MKRSFAGFERITVDPAILGGKPCIRGMRLSVHSLPGDTVLVQCSIWDEQ
ncbi:MAG TPA: DUF433 domain-containing protein [Thermoanaerobaculia bacterium]|nr:DUF433 domain-containing protein [Thermoanaerobaculia bacterium]